MGLFGNSTQKAFKKGMQYLNNAQYEEAFSYMMQAAQDGDATAQYNIGAMYRNGDGVTKDYQKALEWFDKAIEQGHKTAKEAAESLRQKLENDQKKIIARWMELRKAGQEKEAFECLLSLAQEGHATAQYNIGISYYNGNGVEQDYEKALEWAKKSAASGYDKARELSDSLENNMSALLFQRGLALYKAQNYTAAYAVFEKARGYGNLDALARMAFMHVKGLGVPENKTTALNLYLEGAKAGHVESQSGLGNLYGMQSNYGEAVKWTRRAALSGGEKQKERYQGLKNLIPSWETDKLKFLEDVMKFNQALLSNKIEDPTVLLRIWAAAMEGNLYSQWVWGVMYWRGSNVTIDKEESLYWLHLSAEGGFADAQEMLGNIYFYDETYMDKKEGIRWYRKAAEQGSKESIKALGTIYLIGDGTESNLDEAAKWAFKAAETEDIIAYRQLATIYALQGKSESSFEWYMKAAEISEDAIDFRNLAECYYNGKGTPINYQEALKWFLQAAELGDLKAQFWCGKMYTNGEGTSINKNEAFIWLKKAAEQGNHDAQCAIGIMYYMGEGISINKTQAKRWLEAAAAQGDQNAKIILRQEFNQ